MTKNGRVQMKAAVVSASCDTLRSMMTKCSEQQVELDRKARLIAWQEQQLAKERESNTKKERSLMLFKLITETSIEPLVFDEIVSTYETHLPQFLDDLRTTPLVVRPKEVKSIVSELRDELKRHTR